MQILPQELHFSLIKSFYFIKPINNVSKRYFKTVNKKTFKEYPLVIRMKCEMKYLKMLLIKKAYLKKKKKLYI